MRKERLILETEKRKIDCYSMKMQIYPKKEQKEKIETIFRALHIAYNITFHEVFQKNPEVCGKPNDKGDVWPDFRKMAKASWRQYLISVNPIVAEAPAASITTNQGLFLRDAQRAWKTGMHNLPIDPARRPEFRFYSAGKPRRGFMVPIDAKNVRLSPDNPKVAWITIPKIGRVKARGLNSKLWFGENGEHTLSEAIAAGETTDKFTAQVTEDSCGSFYISLTISSGKDKSHELYIEKPVRGETDAVGITFGIVDLATLSTGEKGEKIENKNFKAQEINKLQDLNRKLSRRWGPTNSAYRDYKHDQVLQQKEDPTKELPPVTPSNRYLKTKAKKAKLERKIARRREAYYHRQTAAIVAKSNLIALQSLRVRNLLRNRQMAFALSDAAISDFIEKLKYKAEMAGIEIQTIGMEEPVSLICSECGYKNTELKEYYGREWICPACGCLHDKALNTARNILVFAQLHGSVPDKELPPEKKKKREFTPPPKPFPGSPGLAVQYSRELSSNHNPRYIVLNKKTGEIIDDAQGFGYRSAENAKRCYKAKIRHTRKTQPIKD